jgi:5,10-methenyltetrahydrofolate synthetase
MIDRNHELEWKAWRKQERTRLIAARLAISVADHARWSRTITEHLVQGFPQLNTMAIGFYWPFQGECDPRHAIHHFRQAGARAALPVVTGKGMPLTFREWWPGVAMSRGALDIPVPDATAVLQPQALLMPPVGFDGAGYRLGYGGGYFDRTLVAMTPQPLKIGLAFEVSRMPTIHPRPFDIPMDCVVTELGIHCQSEGALRLVTDIECVGLVSRMIRDRDRPA